MTQNKSRYAADDFRSLKTWASPRSPLTTRCEATIDDVRRHRGLDDDWGSDGEDAFASQGEYELDERNALRRVAGLSTELADVSEVEYRQLRLERVVLVGVWTDGTVEDADNSLAELKLLAETAGSEVLDALSQRRQKPDPATYIGPGKVDDLRAGRRPRPAPTR